MLCGEVRMSFRDGYVRFQTVNVIQIVFECRNTKVSIIYINNERITSSNNDVKAKVKFMLSPQKDGMKHLLHMKIMTILKCDDKFRKRANKKKILHKSRISLENGPYRELR